MKPYSNVVAAAWFCRPGTKRDKYQKLADVWKYSANKIFNEKETRIIRVDAEAPNFDEYCPVFYRGARKIGPGKTLAWREKIRNWKLIVDSIEIGIPILITDIDLAFYGDPFPTLFNHLEDADVGFCGASTGAVYFSGSQRSHDFMKIWYQETEKLVNNKKLYKHLDRLYKGLDQASIQLVIEKFGSTFKVNSLPRRFHSTCHAFEVPAFLMHYHSRMRAACFDQVSIDKLHEDVRPYVASWKKYLEESGTDG